MNNKSYALIVFGLAIGGGLVKAGLQHDYLAMFCAGLRCSRHVRSVTAWTPL